MRPFPSHVLHAFGSWIIFDEREPRREVYFARSPFLRPQRVNGVAVRLNQILIKWKNFKEQFCLSRCKGEKTEMKHSDKIVTQIRILLRATRGRNAGKSAHEGVRQTYVRNTGKLLQSRGSSFSFPHLFLHLFRLLDLAVESGKNGMHVGLPYLLVFLRSVIVQHEHDVLIGFAWVVLFRIAIA